MSNIKRAQTTVAGDITVNSGDVIITDASKGIVMKDNVGDTDRVRVYDDAGVKTIEVDKIS